MSLFAVYLQVYLLFPQDEAAEIAVRTVESYLKETNSTLKVVFNVFTDKDLQLYKEAFNRDAE